MPKSIPELIKEANIVGPHSPIRELKPNENPLKLLIVTAEMAVNTSTRHGRDIWRLQKRKAKKRFPPFRDRAEQNAWLEHEEAEFQRLTMELLDKGLKHNHHRPPAAPVVPMLEMVEPEDLIDGQS